MSYHEITDGRFQVRVEFNQIVQDETAARQLDGLFSAGAATARKKFRDGRNPCPTIREALPRFLDEQKDERDNKPNTIARYHRRLLRFAEDLGGTDGDIAVDRIRREAVHAWMKTRLKEPGNSGKYVESKTLSRDYVNADLAALHRLAEWCVENGYCGRDIEVFSVKRLRVKGKVKNRFKPRSISVPKFKRILAQLREVAVHVEIVLRGMMYLGARPEALFMMEWCDVELPEPGYDGKATVNAVKGGAWKDVPIKPGSKTHMMFVEARQLFKKFHGRTPRYNEKKPVFCTIHGRSKIRPFGWTTDTYDHALDKAVKKAGITDRFTAYVARHCAMTWLAEQGLSETAIQHYAAHLNVSTQRVYRWTSGSEAKPAYEAIEGLLDL